MTPSKEELKKIAIRFIQQDRINDAILTLNEVEE